MKELAIHYYKQGFNCSHCILKAAEQTYSKPISKQCYAMCQGITTGFGVGEMCSVLIAGIMVFGLLFDDTTVKRMRIKLLSEFGGMHPSLDCCELKKERKGNGKCEVVVGEIAELIAKIISEEK